MLGLTTNLRFLRWLVRRPEVIRGEARIDTLDAIWPAGPAAFQIPDWAWAEAARLLDAGGWRLNGPARARLIADEGGEGRERTIEPAIEPPDPAAAAIREGDRVHLAVDGRSVAFRVAPPPDVDRAARAAAAHGAGGGSSDVVAPMPGAVLAVHAVVGETVEDGAPIVTLEAMKMEHVVGSPSAGQVAELLVGVGDQVVRGQLLGRIEPAAG